jgi:peptidoglycan/LPS O-acetylase OafA/YrhL
MYGYLGVKLFFVISGFVISFSAQNRSALQFAVARFCRIYPAFLFCMTVTFLFTLALGGEVFQASLAKWIANATMVVPAGKLQYTMDGAYWSIYAEIIFYGWIALLIAVGWFSRHLTMAIVIWLLISALNQLTLGSFIVEKLFVTDQSGFFAAGVMLFVLRARETNLQNILVFCLATAFAVLQALDEASINVILINAHLNSATLVLLSIGCIALVTAATTIKRVPLPSFLVVALGGLTYPLYLLHQNIGYIIFNKIGNNMPAETLVALVALAMLAVSYLTWRYIDRPGQRLMRQAFAKLPLFSQHTGSLQEARLPKTPRASINDLV